MIIVFDKVLDGYMVLILYNIIYFNLGWDIKYFIMCVIGY